MKRHWGLLILTSLLAAVVVSGCTKKTVLKEEAVTQKQAVSAETKPAKVPEKSTLKADEEAKKRAEREQTEREAALKAQTRKDAVVKEKAAAKELYEFADIHFDFDDFNLKDEARKILGKHAAWLNKNSKATGVIEGHCDERGTAEYNLALGQRRADTAAKYLMDMGIDGKRIKTISYGKERPLDPGHNEAAWAKNRRAHFVISVIK